MEALEQNIIYYTTQDGRCPVREWLDSLRDIRTRAKINVRLRRLSLGNFGFCRPVGAGVLELKIDYGPGYRVYLGQTGARLVVLLCGGVKNTQNRDVLTARVYWNEYRRSYETPENEKD